MSRLRNQRAVIRRRLRFVILELPLDGSTIELDTDIPVAGLTNVPDMQALRVWASIDSGATWIELGAADTSGGAFSTNVQFPSSTFEPGQTVLLKMVQNIGGSILIESNIHTLEIASAEMTDIAGFSYEEGNFLVGEQEDFIIYDD